ncbi:MAG: hypothetical protein HY727_14510 [Candidatus Rokubacteria bacterium]|nr:hypothetical protein [Candidatus Rokubacteria bacterium]
MYERSREDLGNIVALEHVNVRIPDQGVATAFYVVGMGFTRDPYLMVGLDNMWINVGQQQFHLPTGGPQIARAHIGLVVPDLDVLTARLTEVKERLGGTAFACSTDGRCVAVTCPWGNRLRCHAPGPEFGRMTLGIAYVEFPVPRGSAAGIAEFYERVLSAPATTTGSAGDRVTRVRVGRAQELVFRETDAPLPPYDGHHIAIYIANFSAPHRRLEELGLVTEESDACQYRFQEIVDPETRRPLFTLEHEVRSVTHPMYLRPLVNRNPAQRQRTYAPGRDAFVPGMG